MAWKLPSSTSSVAFFSAIRGGDVTGTNPHPKPGWSTTTQGKRRVKWIPLSFSSMWLPIRRNPSVYIEIIRLNHKI
jgi:hypothetical protein